MFIIKVECKKIGIKGAGYILPVPLIDSFTEFVKKP